MNLDKNWWLYWAYALLVVLWLFIASPGRAASGPPTVFDDTLSINLYQTGRTLPEAVSIDFGMGTRRPNAGMAEVMISGWDLDEPGEGTFSVTGCAPVPFPERRIAEHDSQQGAVWLNYPAVCFAPKGGLSTVSVTIEHVNTLGFRIGGVSIWIPEEVSVAPRLSLVGSLQNEGVLPLGFNPAAEPRTVTFEADCYIIGTCKMQALCLESTRNEHHALVTTQALLVRRLVGVEPRLKFMPEFCGPAWAACWPGEQSNCQ